MGHILSEIVAPFFKDCFGFIIPTIGLMWVIYARVRLDRKKFAIEMIKKWNKHTAKDSQIIRDRFVGHHDPCKTVDKSEMEKLFKDKPDEDGRKTREAIIRLFNYFEYISTSYLHKAVYPKVILDSFAMPMLRYFIILEEYLMLELDKTGRNPWVPYTLFLQSFIERGKVDCLECKHNQKCMEKDSLSYKNLLKLNGKKLKK